MIEIRTLVGSKSGEAIIALSWGDKAGQLTAREAREHAHAILEAADAAESDAFLYHFCQQQLGLDNIKACMVMHDFREYRKARNPDKSGSATNHIDQ